jgi:hypothetical protein
MESCILRHADIDTRRALGVYGKVKIPNITLARWSINGFWAEFTKDQFKVLWLFKYGFAHFENTRTRVTRKMDVFETMKVVREQTNAAGRLTRHTIFIHPDFLAHSNE